MILITKIKNKNYHKCLYQLLIKLNKNFVFIKDYFFNNFRD